MLERNCRELENVTLIRAAWDESGKLPIENPGAATWAFQVSDQYCGAGSAARVPAITIMEILELLGVDHIGLLNVTSKVLS